VVNVSGPTRGRQSDSGLRDAVRKSDASPLHLATRVPRHAWPKTPLDNVMTAARLVVLSPESTVATALEQMALHSFHQLPVVAHARVVGLVSRGDILRVLQLQHELTLPPDPQPTGRQSALPGQAPAPATESDTAHSLISGPRR
jgi:hypothetical protein